MAGKYCALNSIRIFILIAIFFRHVFNKYSLRYIFLVFFTHHVIRYGRIKFCRQRFYICFWIITRTMAKKVKKPATVKEPVEYFQGYRSFQFQPVAHGGTLAFRHQVTTRAYARAWLSFRKK